MAKKEKTDRLFFKAAKDAYMLVVGIQLITEIRNTMN